MRPLKRRCAGIATSGYLLASAAILYILPSPTTMKYSTSSTWPWKSQNKGLRHPLTRAHVLAADRLKIDRQLAHTAHLLLDQPNQHHGGHEVLQLGESRDRHHDCAHQEQGDILDAATLLACRWDLRHDVQRLA